MGLSSMSSADLDFDIVDRLATELEKWRREVRGEEIEKLREIKGVRPELALELAAARIGPGSENRTRLELRRGVSGGVSRPWTPLGARELVGAVVLSAGLSFRFDMDRRTRRRAIGRLLSIAGLD